VATVRTRMINLSFAPQLCSCFWSVARFYTISCR